MLMKTERTKSEWAKIVKDYWKSGLTKAEYSRAHGINEKSLGSHVRKAESKRHQEKRTAEEWLVLIEEQQASGMSQATWCKEYGINSDAMNSAKTRMRSKSNKPPEPKWIELNPVKKSEPELPKKEEICWGIKIRGGGIEIEVNSNYSVEKLTSLIERLVKQ